MKGEADCLHQPTYPPTRTGHRRRPPAQRAGAAGAGGVRPGGARLRRLRAHPGPRAAPPRAQAVRLPAVRVRLLRVIGAGVGLLDSPVGAAVPSPERFLGLIDQSNRCI